MSNINAENIQHWAWVAPDDNGNAVHHIAVRADDEFAYAQNLSQKKFDKLRTRWEAGEPLAEVFAKHKIMLTGMIESIAEGEQLGGVVITGRPGAKPGKILLNQPDAAAREELFLSVRETLAPGAAPVTEPVSATEALKAPAIATFCMAFFGAIVVGLTFMVEEDGPSGRRHRWLQELLESLGHTTVIGIAAAGVGACVLWGVVRLMHRADKQVVHLNR